MAPGALALIRRLDCRGGGLSVRGWAGPGGPEGGGSGSGPFPGSVASKPQAASTLLTLSPPQSGSSEKRELRQFQFMAWPDHGVPEYPTPILAFLRRVKACNPLDAGPMVVHCR